MCEYRRNFIKVGERTHSTSVLTRKVRRRGRRRTPQLQAEAGVVAGLDVRHDSGESPPWNAPLAAAVSHIVTWRRRGARRSVVSGEFLEASVGEKLPPEDQVALILEIRVLHGLDGGLDLSGEVWLFHGGDSRLDLCGELLPVRHRRNRDPAGAECPTSGEASVRRGRIERLPEEPGFPRRQRAAAGHG